MLQINGKTFMNLQEAVQWLLDNNALPFQSSANYVANTEIGLGTIVNPSPAKVRIGSLIFFADSKVSTVIGLTENGFICSDQYNNLVDDIAYVTNVSINASGHLITTLSDGQSIDAGQIKQVSGFSIDASQHLIVSFNDGTTTDLGAIFSGNVTISGNLTATGGISGNAITGNSIIENMTGYTADTPHADVTLAYVGAVKNGNKVTFAIVGTLNEASHSGLGYVIPCVFHIPADVGAKLYPIDAGSSLSFGKLGMFSSYNTSIDVPAIVSKSSNTAIYLRIYDSSLAVNTDYYFRFEITFLLSDSLL